MQKKLDLDRIIREHNPSVGVAINHPGDPQDLDITVHGLDVAPDASRDLADRNRALAPQCRIAVTARGREED